MKYFGLLDDPFGNAPSAHVLFQSKTHTEALASLRYAYMKGSAGWALIAASGLGKTFLLNHFVKMIGDSSEKVLLINIDPRSDAREIIFSLLIEIGLSPAESHTQMRKQLEGALGPGASPEKKVIVVIDEAHSLSDSALEEVSWLMGLDTSKSSPIQVILAGRPQLMKILMKSQFAECRHRIATIGRLGALSEKETKAYIDHRLVNSGYCGLPIFSPLAMTMIAEASQGVPNIINSLCFSVLALCTTMKCRNADVRVVAEAIANLELPIELPEEFKVASDAEIEEHVRVSRALEEKMVAEPFWSKSSLGPFRQDRNSDDRAPQLKSSITAEPKIIAPCLPVSGQREQAPQDRHFASNSGLGLTLIFVGIVSAFVLGAVGCLLVMERFPA